MCDDTILDNLEDYINGHIDKLRFLDMMKFNWSDNQISFHTVKALKRIKFIKFRKNRKVNIRLGAMSLPLNLEIENIILRDLVFKSERNDT